MNTAASPLPANILAVDDTPANLQLLTNMLKDHGYKVRPVPNGEMALRAARASPPDLILLDVTMPGMDGYEVCTQLKTDERLRDIPVLFISALDQTTDKVRAFEVGGVDYVTKPFNFAEVEARVKTHLELRRQKRELAAKHTRLQELERMRDNLTHMIAHDMRSPLLSLNLSLDMLNTSAKQREHVDPELTQLALGSVTMLVNMVTEMLDVSRFEAGQMKLTESQGNLVGIAQEVLDGLRPLAGIRQLRLVASEPVMGSFDPGLIRRVLGNLLGNAIKFTSNNGAVTIRLHREPDGIRAEIGDNGPGIPPELQQRIFEKFGQLDNAKDRIGSGLGLTFCKLAVEAHRGQIGVRSAPGHGSVFWFTLPQQAEPAAVAAKSASL